MSCVTLMLRLDDGSIYTVDAEADTLTLYAGLGDGLICLLDPEIGVLVLEYVIDDVRKTLEASCCKEGNTTALTIQPILQMLLDSSLTRGTPSL